MLYASAVSLHASAGGQQRDRKLLDTGQNEDCGKRRDNGRLSEEPARVPGRHVRCFWRDAISDVLSAITGSFADPVIRMEKFLKRIFIHF